MPINNLASWFFSCLYHLFFPPQSCRLTRAEGGTGRLVCPAHMPGAQTAQGPAWLLPFTLPASGSRQRTARSLSPPAGALSCTNRRSGCSGDQLQHRSRGCCFQWAPAAPTHHCTTAEGSFLNGLVPLKYETKSNAWTPLHSRLIHLWSLAARKQNGTEGVKESWIFLQHSINSGKNNTTNSSRKILKSSYLGSPQGLVALLWRTVF